MSRGYSYTGDDSSISKRRLVAIFRWFLYTVLMLLAFSFMSTPGLFSIKDIRPVLLIPLSTCIAIFEGEFAGSIFAVATGIVWATNSDMLFGFHSITLFVCAIFCGLLVTHYLKKTLINAFILATFSTFFYFIVEFYFRYFIWGFSGLSLIITTFYLPMFFYTIAVTPVFFYIVKIISRTFRIDLNPGKPLNER